MMQQWKACKTQSKGSLLLFRLGDFYEAFYEDAALLSEGVGVALTKRQGIPMAGVPFHAAESYIEKLVRKGHNVAIAEQTEDPKKTKGIVKREVVRTLSPGTLISDSYLPEKGNNYIATICCNKDHYALGRLEVSTGSFTVVEYQTSKPLFDDLFTEPPSELIVHERAYQEWNDTFKELRLITNARVTKKEAWEFDLGLCTKALTDHFGIHSLDGFGIGAQPLSIAAAGVLLSYVVHDLSVSVPHIKRITPKNTTSTMLFDRATVANLSLTTSLFSHLDETKTSLGGRLLSEWILHPLLDLDMIEKRADCVQELYTNPEMRTQVREVLSHIKDIERISARINVGTPSPRDVAALKTSLMNVPILRTLVEQNTAPLFTKIAAHLTQPLPIERIDAELVEEPPLRSTEGGMIRSGIHDELDELRAIKKDAQGYLAEYQIRLREETGVKTLKIGYTRAFGYYIEVPKSQGDKLGETFARRQTLTNQERFISEELKTFEDKILRADERIIELENELFLSLCEYITTFHSSIATCAKGIAALDVLQSFAETASLHSYSRPFVRKEKGITISNGRHPIVEEAIGRHAFVPNDTELGSATMHILTGPNMAGKSTYIRQVGLIVIMAQMGAFVPADRAEIGLVDRVFSRIGASDDLSRGQSTFMVEMAETANILHNATPSSLIILDEIGRGTSTYDGMAIAWSVADYLHKKQSLTLFATHYSELADLETTDNGVKTIQVAVQESGDGIVFLHKIIDGKTDKSYGIHVASLAGLPQEVISSSWEKLAELECAHPQPQSAKPHVVEHPIVGKVQSLRLDDMSPREALETLYQLTASLQK